MEDGDGKLWDLRPLFNFPGKVQLPNRAMVFTKRQSNEEKMRVSVLLSFLDIPIANSFRYTDINADVDTAQLYKAYGNGVY